jgi:argininosuccinate lyase
VPRAQKERRPPRGPAAEAKPAEAVLKGRLGAGPDPALEAVSVSVGFDRHLALQDIAGSRAHAAMLHQAGLIGAREAADIDRGLETLRLKVAAGDFPWEPALEDVHMNLERALTDLVGPAGGKLHTARSRNDQVALDERLYLRDVLADLDGALRTLRLALVEKAAAAGDRPMPGYTHLQRAQPVLIAHHLMAYYHMLTRDRARLADLAGRLGEMPLGSGALSGTGLPIKPELVAEALGFAALSPNSLDAVASRDLVLEFLALSAIMMTNLSRLAEDVVLWCSAEFGLAALPDRLATTSSMMPQKKNPDGAELIRGKAGRAVGNLVSLLVTVKGLPMSYNRDLQEDKEPLLDTVETLAKVLPLAARIVEGLEFDYEAARRAAADPFAAATDLADHLVLKGVPFRLAHERVGRLVALAHARGLALAALPEDEVAALLPEADPGVIRELTVDRLLAARSTTPGGTAPEVVAARVGEARRTLAGERGLFPRPAPTGREARP